MAWRFILGYLVFIGFISFIIGLGAPAILENIPPAPTLPAHPPAWWEILGFVVAQLVWYFKVLFISVPTEYPWFGFIMLATTVTFLYIILKLIRGGG